MTRQTVYFSGHVQGVGFRFITRQVAAEFAVTGYVRNLPDGRVLLVVEGEPAEVRAFFDRVREKMDGYIDDLSGEQGPATGEFRAFEIRR